MGRLSYRGGRVPDESSVLGIARTGGAHRRRERRVPVLPHRGWDLRRFPRWIRRSQASPRERHDQHCEASDVREPSAADGRGPIEELVDAGNRLLPEVRLAERLSPPTDVQRRRLVRRLLLPAAAARSTRSPRRRRRRPPGCAVRRGIAGSPRGRTPTRRSGTCRRRSGSRAGSAAAAAASTARRAIGRTAGRWPPPPASSTAAPRRTAPSPRSRRRRRSAHPRTTPA